ncbi:MAG: hypothetical protein NZZ41_00085 [Candidatus Dojkabacteria bacterium]|nr:hypothetical protein [Candidatus Dojkabacteria bacterium]
MSSYPINLSNGTLALVLNNNVFNNTAFNLTLFGRGVSNYGEVVAENFVRLLENFAAPQPPGINPNVSGSPTTGQLWYLNDPLNPANNGLYVRDNNPIYNTLTPFPNWRPVVVSNSPTPNSFGFADGTVTAPSGFFTLDTDTGFFRPGTNQFGITAGGSLSATFNAGNTTSTSVLTINGNTSITLPVGTTGQRPTTPVVGMFRYNSTLDQLEFRDGSNWNTVVSTSNISTIINNNSNNLIAGFADGTVTNPSIYFTADTDTGIYRPGSDTIGFTTGGVEKFRITATGGTFTGNFNLSLGSTLQATYADLAERYETSEPVEPGDLVKIGGEKEIEKTREPYDIDVFGVISNNYAYGMNSSAGNDETHPYVALTGRVKVKVIGKVRKGDRLTSSHVPGVAMVYDKNKNNILSIFGRSLEDKNSEEIELIECVVGVK